MKTEHLDESRNVEDRRGKRSMAVRGGQIGGLGLILVLVASYFLGVDPRQFLNQGALPGSQPAQDGGPVAESAAEKEMRVRAARVLTSTEQVWAAYFREEGQTYPEPGLVIFSQATESGCGPAQSGMGPFYCPADQKIYIDLSFFQDLSQRFGAPGDFAQAYVIAHEVGHHIQTVLGMSGQVAQARARMSEAEGNRLSVALELQADCYAGVWAKRENASSQFLEPGDIQEALAAASAVGDDRLQKAATGRVNPESFTHGTAEQRARWFKTGFDSGRIDACDTFSKPF